MWGGYKFTYQDGLYRTVQDKRARERDKEYEQYHKCHRPEGLKYIYGFPCGQKPWCNSHLKVDVLERLQTDLSRFVLQNIERKNIEGGYRGFPTQKSNYCTSELKQSNLRISKRSIQGNVLYGRTQTTSTTCF